MHAAVSQAARIGAFFSPLILMLADHDPRLPFVVWMLIASVAAGSSLMLPETRGRASLETLSDLSELVALPSPVKSFGSMWRSRLRERDYAHAAPQSWDSAHEKAREA